MAISSEIASTAKLVGEEKAVALFGKAGFDHWDFSMFAMRGEYDWGTKTIKLTGHPLETYAESLKLAKQLREIGEAYGMTCNQSHAPFPVDSPAIRDLLKQSIECTAVAGGDICVIHPDNYKSAEQNAEMYNELLPFAKEHHVRLAAENMWNWNGKQALPAACSSPEDFIAHIDVVNDPYLVACLDLGHAEMYGLNTSAVEMIQKLNRRIAALHIHDNDLSYDSHQIPFSMKIDFTVIAKALKEIDYPGVYTLEADRFMSAYEDNPEEGVKKLAISARRFEQMVKDA